MKKERLFAGFLAAGIIFANLNIPVFAEAKAITVKGTSFINTFSDNKGCAYNSNRKEAIPITAEINVSEAGKYDFTYMGSYGDDDGKPWLSKYIITLNGDSITVPKTPIESNSENTALALFDAGKVWLDEGVNTLSFTPTTLRAEDGLNFNEYVILLDYVTFTPNETKDEHIRVEGEDVKSLESYYPGVSIVAQSSGGKALRIHEKYNGNKSYKLLYNVKAAADGWYNMTSRMFLQDRDYTTNAVIRVNGGKYLAPKNGAAVSGYPSGLPVYDYSFGRVKLKKGINTLEFKIGKDLAEGNIVFFTDYIDFDLISDFEVAQITPDEPCGVFENGSGGYTIELTDESDKDIAFTYKIVDYYGNEENGTVYCTAGNSSAHINLSDCDNGWYKIEIAGMGENYTAAFSVVDKYSERYSGDTPFAADFASGHKSNYIQDRRDLSRAARLAGVKWMRERISWQNMDSDGKINTDLIREVTDDINNEGINVLPMLGTNGSDWQSSIDAVKIYNAIKQMAGGMNEKSSTLEIFNEVDGGFTGVPADVYAAFYKAAAIGAVDGGGQSVFAGLIQDKNSDFRKLLMANDAMNYSAAYNSHFHLFYGSGEAKETIDTEYITDERDFGTKEGMAKPFWVTEAGMYMSAVKGENPSEDKLRHQARYLATSMPEAIANGLDKYFWFLWREYYESGYEMGTFDYDNNTFPVYAAYAAVTSALGKGKFIGSLARDDVKGYVFEANDEGKQTLALWCSDGEKNVTLKTDSDVVVSDMMGRKSNLSPTGGIINITAKNEPVYVLFPNGVNENDYYRKEYNTDRTPITLNEEDKIVFRQEFYENGTDRTAKLSDAKGTGYEVNGSSNTTIKLYVTNLNNQEETVTLTGSLKDFDLSMPESVTIPAMGEVSTDVTLIPKNPEKGRKLYLSLSGKIGSSDCSPSVSAVYVKNTEVLRPTETVDGFENIGNWSRMTGAAKTITKKYVSSDSFDYMQLSVDKWVSSADKNEWIGLKVSDAERAKLYNGLTYSIRTPDGTSDNYRYSTRLYFDYGDKNSNGKTVYTIYATGLGHAGIPVSSSWQQVTNKWSDFQRIWSPMGGNDTRQMDLSKLAYIAIGGSFGNDSIMFEIGNFGYINIDDGAPVINISGIEEGKVYESSAAELDNVLIIMPQGYNNPIVTINERPALYEADGNIIKPVLSSLPGGNYRFAVIAKSESGEVKPNTRFAELYVNFTVEKGNGSFDEKVEGENLSCQALGFTKGYVSEKDGKRIDIGYLSSNNTNSAAMQIYVPESGTYKIRYGATRNEDLGWLKPYYFTVDSGTKYQIKNKAQSSYNNDIMAVYECEVNLNKGINTLTFVSMEERTDGQKYLIYIDYLDITYVGRKNITQPEENKVIVCEVTSEENKIKITAADTSDNLKKSFITADKTKDGKLLGTEEIKKEAAGSFVPYVVEFDKPEEEIKRSVYIWDSLTEMQPLSEKTDF